MTAPGFASVGFTSSRGRSPERVRCRADSVPFGFWSGRRQCTELRYRGKLVTAGPARARSPGDRDRRDTGPGGSVTAEAPAALLCEGAARKWARAGVRSRARPEGGNRVGWTRCADVTRAGRTAAAGRHGDRRDLPVPPGRQGDPLPRARAATRDRRGRDDLHDELVDGRSRRASTVASRTTRCAGWSRAVLAASAGPSGRAIIFAAACLRLAVGRFRRARGGPHAVPAV